MTEAEEYKEFAKAMVDYTVDFLENTRDRRVLPTVKPGYLRKLIPEGAPTDPETWQDVMKDIERVIMPGITQWHSPHFHAYYPAANSYPAVVADMLSGAIACTGFSWITSPACTELEVVMLDWLGKMCGLPKEFLACEGTGGGGVIQGTASESTFVSLLSARTRALNDAKKIGLGEETLSKLVAYTSSHSHSSAEKAGRLGAVQIRLLATDENFALRGETLQLAIDEDKKNGLIPFFVCATSGTTNSCAFDHLEELGPICEREKIWMHVDAAYAGAALVCPEYRHLMNGIEYADSFNFSPHKFMLVNLDCSALWLKDTKDIKETFRVGVLHEKHEDEGEQFRNWQIHFGRRFRSLKLWFVMRLYGVQGIQQHIRKHVGLAKGFEKLVKSDSNFEIVAPVVLGLVCFRLKSTNENNEELLRLVNENGKIHIVSCILGDKFTIRFCVCARTTELKDIQFAWNEIKSISENIPKQ